MTTPIYTIVTNLLKAGKKLILARIVRRSGSAPRDVGSMCIVTKDDIFGSVGGGSIEYQMVKSARQLLNQGRSSVYQFRMNNEDVAGSGMICGGDVDLFLEPVFPGNEIKFSLYHRVAQLIGNHKPGIMVTKIMDRIPADKEDANLLVMPDQTAIGAIEGLAPQHLNFEYLDSIYKQPFELISSTDTTPDLFIERIDLTHRVVLFGAGHVSDFVARLAKMVGFHVTVIDDRVEFANHDRFPDADRIIVNGFETVFNQLNITPTSYILILTRGHLYDKNVLEDALGTKAGYIGMIGSRRKRNLIYQSLLEKGFKEKDLDRVSSPVGIAIEAQTPEEIAVSIVAELIRERAPEKKAGTADQMVL